MTDWPREPLHPSEPSPLEVALILANPWNWMRLGMATNVWALGWLARRFG